MTAGRSVVYAVSARYTSPFALHGASLDDVSIAIDGEGMPASGAVVELGFARD